MDSKNRYVVDTYAIIAEIYDEIPEKAHHVLEEIRRGASIGFVHELVVYELYYHWKENRLLFRSSYEIRDFINTYFTRYSIDDEVIESAVEIKLMGSKILRESLDLQLRRSLSISDSLTIAIAKREKIPIVTGDKDLSHVAESMGLTVIW